MRRGPIIAAMLIVAAGATGWWWIKSPPGQSPQSTAQKRGEGKRGMGKQRADAAPVTVATVRQEAVPVYREGIGTVQALNNVTVRSQVDGRLLSVEFKEGQSVKKGDVLARIDPTTYRAQYDQAVAKKAQDEATLANARIDLGRYQRLAQTNAGPKQQADSQAALVAQLEAQVNADAAAIANAKAVLDYTTIASPLDGRTGLRLVDPGNIVKAGDASGIVTITQIQPIAVVFTLPQRDLGPVNAALARGEVPVEVLDSDARGVLARGQLQTVDNQIDVSTGTIRLKAVFANADNKLWPGQFVSTRVVVDVLADAKVVPTAAVRRGPNGTFVYAIEPEAQKAVVRPVTVVMQDAVRAVIASGVTPGEQVVTLGFQQLSDGKNVDVPPAAGEGPPAASAPQRKRGPGAERKGDGKVDGKEAETAPDGKRRRRDAGSADKSG